MTTKRDLLKTRFDAFIQFLEPKVETKFMPFFNILRSLSLDEFITKIKTEVVPFETNLEQFISEWLAKVGAAAEKLTEDDKIKIMTHMKAFILIAKHL